MRKQNHITLDLRFRASPIDISPRAIAVSNAFGVGVDDRKEFIVFDHVPLEYNNYDLIYVTGDSGSGKSTFLKLFREVEEKRGRKCLSFEDIQVDENCVVIDGIGKNTNDSMNLLGTVGLSEAFVMLRKFKELSDGQKYRFKLAKVIEQDAEVFFIDEFGASLDRDMAKTLAYCFQKWARRNGKMLVIATTHRDLLEDFNPNTLLDKKFGETTTIQYFQPSPEAFSLIREMSIQSGTLVDYKALAHFHYLHGQPAANRFIFKLVYHQEIIGVILYTVSFLNLSLRNKIFPEYKTSAQQPTHLATKRVNSEILRISRIIIHPKYRGVGLAAELIRRTMPLCNVRIVETVAAMASHNPFFEKAGMVKVGKMEFNKSQKAIIDFCHNLGVNFDLLWNREFRKQFLNSLTASRMQMLITILEDQARTLAGISSNRSREFMEKLQQGQVDEILSKALPVERVYLYWLNPEWQAQTHTPTLSASVAIDDISQSKQL
jgi:ABC-type lipoprotein export system ATPase subunit